MEGTTFDKRACNRIVNNRDLEAQNLQTLQAVFLLMTFGCEIWLMIWLCIQEGRVDA